MMRKQSRPQSRIRPNKAKYGRKGATYSISKDDIDEHGRAVISHRELRRLSEEWPRVLRHVHGSTFAGFATRIWDEMAEPFWKPTARQLRLMLTLMREAEAAEADDLEVISEE